MDQVIATVEKNADEEIRVSLREYKAKLIGEEG